MRLYDHRPFGHFATSRRSYRRAGAVLGDPDLLLRQRIENGGNRAEIVILFLKYQVYMDYFCHSIFRIFFVANIPNNHYME